jgi:hypothetical protein
VLDEVLGRSVDEVEEISVLWGHFEGESEVVLVLYSASELGVTERNSVS